MATGRDFHCSLCKADDSAKEAVTWCIECEEWLCAECKNLHVKEKLAKQHKTVTVHDYNNLPPPKMLTISDKCTKHRKALEYFCTLHEVACCIKCNRDYHKQCTLRPIGEFLENIKASPAISNLEEDLNSIKENFVAIEKHLAYREVQIKEQHSKCLQEVRVLRKQLNDHLDVIEKRLTDELAFEQTKLQIKIDTLKSKIESKMGEIGNVQKELSIMREYATNLQLFLTTKKIEQVLSQETRFVEELRDGECKEDKILYVKLSPVLQTLQADVMSFGKIIIDSIPSSLKLKIARQQQAQIRVSVKPTTIDEIKVQRKNYVGLRSKHITGCAILPGDLIALTEYNRRSLLIYNILGEFIKDVRFPSSPQDVCVINDNTVAVSFLDKNRINFVDIEEGNICRTILVESGPTGIDSDGNQIVIACFRIKTIFIVSVYGKILNRIATKHAKVERVTMWQNQIFFTDFKENKIVCCDTIGNFLWTYENKTLDYPYGIVVDKTGFVYVAVENSNQLLVISPDGKRSKVLLDKKDGLDIVTHVSIYKDKLLLGNRFEGHTYYSISHLR